MKKWLKIVLIAVLALAVIFIGGSAYLGYDLTRVKRVPVDADPAGTGLASENVSFTAGGSDLTLRGWLFPVTGTDKIVIMVHGEEQHRADDYIKMLDIAINLVRDGYPVLTFDLRGHGESGGDMISGGYFEREDVGAAVSYVKIRGYNRIAVLGFSMGGVAALLEAGDNPEIDAVISDSAFADLTDMMEKEFKSRAKAPTFLLRPLLFLIKTMYGVDFYAIRPVQALPAIAPRPIFFIHGELDQTIPVEHLHKFEQASHNSANCFWEVPKTDHVRAYADHPLEYMERLTAFLDTALK